MSGIEVAGLILGAIPIITSALTQYQASRQTWHSFRRKSLFIDRLIQALRYQKVLIETDLIIALRAVGVEQEDTSRGSFGDLSSILNRSDVLDSLERFFGRAYMPYMEGLYECERILQDIAKDIRGLLPDSHSGDLEELSSINRTMGKRFEIGRRLKFSIERKDIEQRINDLQNTTEMLRKLRQHSSELQKEDVPMCSLSMTRFNAFYQNVQSRACSLYEAVSRGLSSGCHEQHEAMFYLENSVAVSGKTPVPALGFRLIVIPRSNTGDISAGACEVHVDMLETNSDNAMSIRSSNIGTGSDKIFISSHRAKQLRGATDVSDMQASHRSGLTNIQNLCTSLHEAREAKLYLEVYLSRRGNLSCRQMPYKELDKEYSDGCSPETMTLAQVLVRKLDGGVSNWSLVQRLVLACLLTSALLHIGLTPWLAGSLTKETICFLRLKSPPEGRKGSLEFAADHPFVVHKFPDQGRHKTRESQAARGHLLDLGIILLELWHGTSIETWAALRGLRVDRSEDVRGVVARSWLDERAGDIIPSYHHLVSRCVNCAFPMEASYPDWQDQLFTKAVFEKLVRPLWEMCRLDDRSRV